MSFDTVRFSSFCSAFGQLTQLFSGMSCESWGRSPAHNAAVGGKPASQHLDWTAADVKFDSGSEPSYDSFRAATAAFGLLAIPEVGGVQTPPGAPHDHWHIQLVLGPIKTRGSSSGVKPIAAA